MKYGVTQERDWNALSDDDFRAIIREEFEAHYPAELRFPPRRLRWAENQGWFRRMAAKGWIAPNWPVEYGGMGLSGAKVLTFIEEQERWGIARYQDHGVLMIGPVLIRFGTDEQRRRFLPPILACEELWCQGYSEPNAGSDLAGLRTRGRIEGDEIVIDGQKIWTTLAQDATHIFVLTRTDPDAKPQAGISFVLVAKSAPGVTVRPIRDIAGHEEFCEVFFDGVRSPTANIVGELNAGWGIAKSLLGFERISLGSPKFPQYGLQVLLSVAEARGLTTDPLFRDKLSGLQLDVAHLADAYAGFAKLAAQGAPIGHDVSFLKIFATETFRKIADVIVEVAGPFAAIAGDVAIANRTVNVLGSFYKSRTATIYGGSNEIQRNILAKQVLGLPTS